MSSVKNIIEEFNPKKDLPVSVSFLIGTYGNNEEYDKLRSEEEIKLIKLQANDFFNYTQIDNLSPNYNYFPLIKFDHFKNEDDQDDFRLYFDLQITFIDRLISFYNRADFITFDFPVTLRINDTLTNKFSLNNKISEKAEAIPFERSRRMYIAMCKLLKRKLYLPDNMPTFEPYFVSQSLKRKLENEGLE